MGKGEAVLDARYASFLRDCARAFFERGSGSGVSGLGSMADAGERGGGRGEERRLGREWGRERERERERVTGVD